MTGAGNRRHPRRERRAPRRAILVLCALTPFAVLAGWDWSREPARQWTVRAELETIARYQAWISPLLSRGGARCRFTPSCSHYAAAVVARDGAVRGNLRAAWRILRCAPWTKAGTPDPP